jgi:GTP-binding protein HflX
LKALIETATKRSERVFLVGLEFKSRTTGQLRDSLQELGELAATAGADVIGNGIQSSEAPVAGTFIGRGKAQSLPLIAIATRWTFYFRRRTFSPKPQPEKVFECKVLDRTALILDILPGAPHSRRQTAGRTGSAQHLLPRLTRFWGHLSRQKGGIGMRVMVKCSWKRTARVQDRIARFSEELNGCAASEPRSARSPTQPLAAGVYCGLHQCRQIHAAEHRHRGSLTR